MAEARMRAGGCDMLQVVDGRRLLGHVTRADIDRCRRHGNWLDAVLVVGLVDEARKPHGGLKADWALTALAGQTHEETARHGS
ncbi:MAG: hypothetical protein R3D25_13980 [Geminicoccaceae bacterium]